MRLRKTIFFMLPMLATSNFVLEENVTQIEGPTNLRVQFNQKHSGFLEKAGFSRAGFIFLPRSLYEIIRVSPEGELDQDLQQLICENICGNCDYLRYNKMVKKGGKLYIMPLCYEVSIDRLTRPVYSLYKLDHDTIEVTLKNPNELFTVKLTIKTKKPWVVKRFIGAVKRLLVRSRIKEFKSPQELYSYLEKYLKESESMQANLSYEPAQIAFPVDPARFADFHSMQDEYASLQQPLVTVKL